MELAGRRFYDAGLSESVPYRTALEQGATHVLVLRSRRDPLTLPDGRVPARSLRPPPGSPVVSRLATGGRLLREAFESGRVATHTALIP